MERSLGKVILLIVCFITVCFSVSAQQVPSLGTAFGYNVLSAKKIASTGGTVINANVGVANGIITGFPPGIAMRGTHANTAAARIALQDAAAAFNKAMAMTPTEVISSKGNLADRIYKPGVYRFDDDAVLSGNMILDDNGQQNAVYIFQVEDDLKVSRSAAIDATNKATTSNILWVVGGDVDISSNAILDGSFIVKGSINLATGVNLQGRIVSLQDDISLNQALINTPSDLSVSIAMSPSTSGTTSYQLGDEVTITITAKNLGPSDESIANGTISLIGDILSYTSVKSGSSFNAATKEWNIGSLAFDQSAVLVIKAKLTQSGFGTVQARVEGRSGNVDEDLNNNTAIPYNYCVLLSASGPIAGETQVCVSKTYAYSIAPVVGAAKYTWSVPPGWSYERLGPASILVTPGSTAAITSGLITVRASSICGEGPPQSLQVTLQANAPKKPGPITGPSAVCANTKGLEYSIAAVPDAANYKWVVPYGWSISEGQGTTEITVNAGSTQGDISVEAINSCGISEIQTLRVATVTDLLVAPKPIQGTAQGCVGSTIVYKTEAVSGATGYAWTVPGDWKILSGQNTTKVSVKAGTDSGDITVQATNACGTGPKTILAVSSVTTPPEKPGAILGLRVVCAGQKSIKYRIAPVANATSYTWLPGNWKITSGQGTNEIIVDADSRGTTIEVRAENACEVTGYTQFTTVVAASAPAKPVITGNVLPCIGKIYTYSIASQAHADSYTWEIPDGWEKIAESSTSVTVKAGEKAGAIAVKIANGCGTSEGRLAVNGGVSQLEGLGDIVGSSQVCVGSTAAFKVEGVLNAGTYAWQVPLGWAIVSGHGTAAIQVKAGTNKGNISVIVRNGCDELYLSEPVTVADLPLITLGKITGASTMCEDSPQTYTIDAVAGAASYTWSYPPGWVIVSGQGTTTFTVKAGREPGNIGVAAVNACGNPGPASEWAVTPSPVQLTAPTITKPANNAFCQGTPSLTYSIQAVAGATSYRWEKPEGWQITAGQGTTTIKVTAGTGAGIIKVIVGNSCGANVEASVPVSSRALPAAPKLTARAPNPCIGINTEYVVEADANVTSYKWVLPLGWSRVPGTETNRITVIPTATAGVIRVKAVNACGESEETVLAVAPVGRPPVALSAITGEQVVCQNETLTYTVAEVPFAGSYNWHLPEGWTILQGQGTSTIVVRAADKAGAVKVAAANGCGASAAATLDVQLRDLSQVDVITDLSSACGGLVYEIAPMEGALEYKWSVPEGWSIATGQGTNRITVNAGKATGKIAVVVRNGKCLSEVAELVPNTVFLEAEAVIPNVFTPNSDGDNDTWVIENLANFPENDLTVVNRWGNEVYRSQGYQNNWDGSSLHEGTYFYVLKVKLCSGAEKVYKGYVMIVR